MSRQSEVLPMVTVVTSDRGDLAFGAFHGYVRRLVVGEEGG